MVEERDSEDQALEYFASPPGALKEEAEGMEPPTALVKISPEIDRSFLQLESEALGLRGFAEQRAIINGEGVVRATDDLSIMANLKKAIEEKRKEYVGPLNAHVKVINEAFKRITEPLQQADQMTRDKILMWRREQERKRAEAEEIQRLEEEARARRAKLAQDQGEPAPEEEVLPAPVVPDAPAARVHTDMGTLGTATIWKFEVVDFSLLPDRFKMENATLIGKVVRAGEREIPGVEIFEESTLRVQPR